MIDARGFSCPIPVVMVQNEIKKNSPSELSVTVDNKAAVENISRYAKLQKYTVSVEEKDSDFILTLKK